jgi:hypothetical protein
MIPELEQHKIIVKELGNMEVVPYVRVIEFVSKLQEQYLDNMDKALKELQEVLLKISENTD